jgi:hypothetical protein
LVTLGFHLFNASGRETERERERKRERDRKRERERERVGKWSGGGGANDVGEVGLPCVQRGAKHHWYQPHLRLV